MTDLICTYIYTRFPLDLSSIRLLAAGGGGGGWFGATKVNDNLIMSLTGFPGNQDKDRMDTKPEG